MPPVLFFKIRVPNFNNQNANGVIASRWVPAGLASHFSDEGVRFVAQLDHFHFLRPHSPFQSQTGLHTEFHLLLTCCRTFCEMFLPVLDLGSD